MMISRRPQPIIGKLTGNWGSGGNSGSAISPRSPLEIMNIQSTKGPKKYDYVCGVGLGIAAALGKSEHSHVSHRRDTDKPILHTRNQSRSNHVHLEMENSEEDYTFVTCHEPNKTNTRVYYNDGVGNCNGTVTRKNDTCFDTKSVKKHGSVMFDISASRFSDEVEDFPDNDFLEFCHLCRKTLHGKDIYMYRGEKSFCSTECRYVEMVKDEKKEKKKCRSDVVASR